MTTYMQYPMIMQKFQRTAQLQHECFGLTRQPRFVHVIHQRLEIVLKKFHDKMDLTHIMAHSINNFVQLNNMLVSADHIQRFDLSERGNGKAPCSIWVVHLHLLDRNDFPAGPFAATRYAAIGPFFDMVERLVRLDSSRACPARCLGMEKSTSMLGTVARDTAAFRRSRALICILDLRVVVCVGVPVRIAYLYCSRGTTRYHFGSPSCLFFGGALLCCFCGGLCGFLGLFLALAGSFCGYLGRVVGPA